MADNMINDKESRDRQGNEMIIIIKEFYTN